MKNLHNIFKITLFAAQFSFSPIWGQGDTTKVSYSEESGTLEKQRFIDRYDYVFMTKEPTKWMVKGYGTSIGPTTFSSWKSLITAPYGAIEHKLSPSFSLQLEGKFHDPNYSGIFESTNNRLGGAGITAKNLSLTLTGEIRWYYDMAKRIRKDLSANNFSGNYWSVRYGRRFNDKTFLFNTSFGLATQNDSYVTDYFYGLSKHQVSLTYGIQRRFFRFGLIDMSINLNYLQREIVQQQIQFPGGNNRIIPNQRPDFSLLTASYETVGQEDVWFVDTKLQFGMALADFKKKFRRPACDWLKCYENQSNMIKIGWPYLSLGLKQQLVRGFVGYEQKILSSPFSLNGYLTYDFYNSFNRANYIFNNNGTYSVGSSSSLYLGYSLSVQARYYFLLTHRIRQGKSGNHLSGFYAGVNARSGGYHSSYNTNFDNTETNVKSNNSGFAGIAPMIGFQQKLFKNGFIDVSHTFSSIIAKTQALRNQFTSNSDFTIRTGLAF